MKLIRYGILFSSISALSAITVCRPHWLSENTFLESFVSHEIISVLIVVLTITFASVGNMQLTLNRIELRLPIDKRPFLRGVRESINSEAWLLFWFFIVCVGALVLKGSSGGNTFLIAASHAVSAVVLLVNVLVLHTVYRTIFALVSAENLFAASSDNAQEGTEDFTSNSPPAGQR